MKKYLLTFALGTMIALCAVAQEQTQPDRFAEYPGGIAAFYEFIEANLVYPEDALVNKVSGVVYVDFIVRADGEIKESSIKVKASLSPSCDKEAIRIIKASPKWIPGVMQSRAVEQLITVPVSFNLP